MGQLQSAIDQLAVEDVGTFTNPELSDSLVELEAGISRLESERNRRLALFASRKTHLEFEYSSATAFLIDRCRIAPSRAGRLVASAQALSCMPATFARWREGMLASDQVRHLVTCHQADPDSFSAHEQMLCDTVAGLGVIDCGKALSYWRELVNRQTHDIEAEMLYARRYIHLSQTFEGMFRLDGYLDPVSGELVREALEALTPPPAAGDIRTPVQRRADALTDMARQVMDTGQQSEQGGEKPHLTVLISPERLHGIPTGIAETMGGTVFTQSTLDLLACDCAISRIVLGPNSEVIDVGRKTRIIPAALRRAVIARDRHCQHPGCRRPAKWCDIDHIIAWQHGGHTRLDNLQLLCRYHHRLKHLRAGPTAIHPLRQQPACRETRGQVMVRARK